MRCESLLCGLLLFGGLGAVARDAEAQPAPAGNFPAAEWPTQSLKEAGIDEARFAALLDYLFPVVSAEVERARTGVRTDAFLLIGRNGQLLYERYARGYGPTSRHYGWSMTKTVLAALVGIAE